MIMINPSFPDCDKSPQWGPQLCEVSEQCAIYKNNTGAALAHPKHAHFKTQRLMSVTL